MRKKIIKFLTLSTLLAPALVYAQDVFDIFTIIINILLMVIEIALVFIIVAFFYGLAIFIRNSGDEKTLTEGKQWMLWSVAALFVVAAIWGILGFFQASFLIDSVIIPPLQESAVYI